MTDEDLIRQLQQGSQAAVEPLVRRYHRPLVAYFYRLSHDYHLAQDLAQECLFRLVSRAGQYQFPRPVKPWVYQIAANLWRDHRKSAAYRHGSAALPLDEAAEMPEAGPPPDDDVASRLLAHEARAVADEVLVLGDRVSVTGHVDVSLLYVARAGGMEGQVQFAEWKGALPFEAEVAVPGAYPPMQAQVDAFLADLHPFIQRGYHMPSLDKAITDLAGFMKAGELKRPFLPMDKEAMAQLAQVMEKHRPLLDYRPSP
ncbi:MAG: DUF3794 domain-containing protein [Limnochordales bacterium]